MGYRNIRLDTQPHHLIQIWHFLSYRFNRLPLSSFLSPSHTSNNRLLNRSSLSVVPPSLSPSSFHFSLCSGSSVFNRDAAETLTKLSISIKLLNSPVNERQPEFLTGLRISVNSSIFILYIYILQLIGVSYYSYCSAFLLLLILIVHLVKVLCFLDVLMNILFQFLFCFSLNLQNC